MVNGKVFSNEPLPTTCAHCNGGFKKDADGNQFAFRGHDKRLYCSAECATMAYATLLSAHEGASREVH